MSKILTIDDSKAVRLIIKRALSPYECAICEAANGEEGLAVAASEKPDLIVLDITMPVMDGITMLTKLKADATAKDIPVLRLSAAHGVENVAKIMGLGARDYIVKPFKDEQIVEKVLAILPLSPKAVAA